PALTRCVFHAYEREPASGYSVARTIIARSAAPAIQIGVPDRSGRNPWTTPAASAAAALASTARSERSSCGATPPRWIVSVGWYAMWRKTSGSPSVRRPAAVVRTGASRTSSRSERPRPESVRTATSGHYSGARRGFPAPLAARGDGRRDLQRDRLRLPRNAALGAGARSHRVRPALDRHLRDDVLPVLHGPDRRGGRHQVRLPVHDRRELGKVAAPVRTRAPVQGRRRSPRRHCARRDRAGLACALPPPRPRRAAARLGGPAARPGAGRAGRDRHRAAWALRHPELVPRLLDGAPLPRARARLAVRRHGGGGRHGPRAGGRDRGDRRGRRRGVPALPERADRAARPGPTRAARLRRPVDARHDGGLAARDVRLAAARNGDEPAPGRVLPHSAGAAVRAAVAELAGAADPPDRADA